MQEAKSTIVAVILAMVAVAVFHSHLGALREKLFGDAQLVDVVLARHDILDRKLISQDDVEVSQVPRKYLQPGAVRSVEELEDRVTVTPIKKGEQVLATKLIGIGGQTGVSFVVKDGYRAVSVAVDEVTGVGGLVRPGDYVDIIGTFELTMGGRSQKRSKTLFENVPVLAVGSSHVVGQPISGLGSEVDDHGHLSNNPYAFTQVTVSLPPQEAQDLILAQESGVISLIARYPLDKNQNGVTQDSQLSKLLGIKQPSLRPYIPRYREMRF